jgi:hypothetical protein
VICGSLSPWHSGVPRIFFRGVQQIQLRTEGTENGDLGAVVPYLGVPLNLQMSETRMLIRLLRMYFPRNRELGSALSKKTSEFRGGGGGVKPPRPPQPRQCPASRCRRRNPPPKKKNSWCKLPNPDKVPDYATDP